MSVPAIILAAGASRRLGRPKQLVCVEDETLLGRTIRVTREAGASPVLVVLGAHSDRILAEVNMAGVQPVIHSAWEQGIATSIHAGVGKVQETLPHAAGVLLLVCDQPRLTAQHLRSLIAGFEEATSPTIVASAYAGIVGIPAIIPASQFADLLELSGDTGARYLLRHPRCALLTVNFEGGEVDLDTPEDLSGVC